MKNAFDFIFDGFGFFIKTIIAAGFCFILLPFFLLYMIGVLSSDNVWSWGGWPYVIIYVSVISVFTIYEIVKMVKSSKKKTKIESPQETDKVRYVIIK